MSDGVLKYASADRVSARGGKIADVADRDGLMLLLICYYAIIQITVVLLPIYYFVVGIVMVKMKYSHVFEHLN